MNKKPCYHNGCKLPLNNNRYLWQMLYTIFGLIVLFWKTEQFTFFQVALFVFPILIDVSYGTLESKLMNFVRKCFITLNVLFFIFCMLGLANVIDDTGNSFYVYLEVLNLHFSVTKVRFGWVMIPNIIIPVLYYGCSPCRKNEETIVSARHHEKGGVK